MKNITLLSLMLFLVGFCKAQDSVLAIKWIKTPGKSAEIVSPKQTDSAVITTGNYWRKGFAVLKDDTIKIGMLVTPDNVRTIYGYKIYKVPKFYKAIPYLEAPKYLDSNFHPLPTGFIVWDYTQIK